MCVADDSPIVFPVWQAEARAEFAERSVQKLQKEVDRLEGITFRFIFSLSTIIPSPSLWLFILISSSFLFSQFWFFIFFIW